MNYVVRGRRMGGREGRSKGNLSIEQEREVVKEGRQGRTEVLPVLYCPTSMTIGLESNSESERGGE